MLPVLLAVLLSQAPTPHPRQQGVPIGQGKTLPTVRLTAPVGGWTVDRMLLVEGTVSDTTIDPVVLSINGDRYLMRTFSGRFQRKFPAASGKNVVTVLATNQAGTARAQATSYARIPPVPLKAILTSDTLSSRGLSITSRSLPPPLVLRTRDFVHWWPVPVARERSVKYFRSKGQVAYRTIRFHTLERSRPRRCTGRC